MCRELNSLGLNIEQSYSTMLNLAHSFGHRQTMISCLFPLDKNERMNRLINRQRIVSGPVIYAADDGRKSGKRQEISGA